MLDWDDLRSFLAIARQGSLSGAARALGVQQSTMSRRLEALEGRAGARLLQKTPGGYVLTLVGETILGNVERIEAEALAVERRITGRDIRLEGTVRLTSVETLAAELLVPELVAFHAAYPGISLELVTDTRALSLTKREADIALRMARLSQNDLAVRKVGDVGFGLYAAPDYLARHGLPDFAGGAAGHGVIRVEGELMATPDMAWFAGLTPNAMVTLRSNSRYAHLAAAQAGLGIACLAHYLAERHSGLVRLTPPAPPPLREIWLAVHNDIRHTPRIRAVTDFLAAVLKRQAGRLNPMLSMPANAAG
jgi:DNA-binding transcriptional LysR family regulator